MIPVLVAGLRELAKAIPREGCEWEQQPTFFPPSTPKGIEELERLAGFPLPADLRQFFATTDAVIGMSVHNGYQIGGTDVLLRMIRSAVVPRTAPDGPAVLIAVDGGGNAFLLSMSGRVWRWNHETGNLVSVADSFGMFLERVVADWTAYVNDTPGWTFLV